jgi:hypothetical protein
MTGFRRCSIRIRKLRGRSLLRRFTLSATKRTARFMLCLPSARKHWKRRCSNGSTTGEKTLSAGKQADLVVIKGDPSKKIEEIENVETVFKAGIGYDSKKLIDSVRGQLGIR